MAFDLEVLVGHLYVVGGRSISATPPGALVEVAPKKAARGREPDTFFTLVLPSGDATAPTTFYQQMAQLAAERYFSNSGSVTAALRFVTNNLNQNLFEHNDSGHRHYEANMICAVLRGTELYLARVGAAIAILQLDAETLTYPEDLTNDEALFRPPLGVQPIPDVRMKRYQVNSGTRLVLGDSPLADLDREKVIDAMVVQDIEKVLDAYKDLVMDSASLMVVEFVPPDEPSPAPVAVGESSAVIAAEVAAARSEARTRTEETAPKTATESAPKPRKPRSSPLKPIKKLLGGIVGVLAAFLSALNRLLDVFIPPPKEGESRRIFTPVTSTVVVVIPIAIVAIVVLAWAGNVGGTAFEQCLSQANDAADIATSLDQTDVTGIRTAWQAVLEITAGCNEMRPNDATIRLLRTQAQEIIDRQDRITRLEARLITEPLPNANLGRIILRGYDMYVLDEETDLVYRLILGDDRLSVVNREAITSMRRGATVDGYQIGDIIDFGFSTDGLTALDSNGVLVTCNPQFTSVGCDAHRVAASERWVNPIAMKIWSDRLYVLDTGINQIWRYTPSGGEYVSTPQEYFGGQIIPNIASAVDFEIDEQGLVYIITQDGTMTQWRGGEPLSFGFSEFPAGQELANATVTRMYLNDNAIDKGFYIISQRTRTIYETTKAGTLIRTYRTFDETQLAAISDIAVDSTGIIYVTSGNGIFAIKKGDS